MDKPTFVSGQTWNLVEFELEKKKEAILMRDFLLKI